VRLLIETGRMMTEGRIAGAPAIYEPLLIDEAA
jgi:hypothetical protein